MSDHRDAPVDFNPSAADYRRYRVGFPPEFFARLQGIGVGLPGQRVVDFGTGTGTIARGMAQRGCQVIGVDPATRMLDEARILAEEDGVSVRYLAAPAEATGLPARSADVVTAGQCWHWFDRARAANEAKRLLVPQGRLVIAHFDWVPLRGNIIAATHALILEHNPAWATTRPGNTPGHYPRWFEDVASAGFVDLESFTFDVSVAYSHAAWRGRLRASAGVGASLPPEGVARFDAELARLLAEDFPSDPLDVPHRVFALLATSR